MSPDENQAGQRIFAGLVFIGEIMKRFCLMCLIVVFTTSLLLGGCTRKQESAAREDSNTPVRFFWPPTILQRESFLTLPVLTARFIQAYIIDGSTIALGMIITTIPAMFVFITRKRRFVCWGPGAVT
jgi:hypothetical protein